MYMLLRLRLVVKMLMDQQINIFLPSLLWHCWLGWIGVKKSIQTVIKVEWRLCVYVLAWLSVWNEIQIICIVVQHLPSRLHYVFLIKIQNGFTFLVGTSVCSCLGKDDVKWIFFQIFVTAQMLSTEGREVVTWVIGLSGVTCLLAFSALTLLAQY